MDDAIWTFLDLDRQQRELSDLLTANQRVSYLVPVFEPDSTRVEAPSSRRAKLCAGVLPWNPYFKDAAIESRRLLGIPAEGLPTSDPEGFRESARLGLAMNIALTPYVWALWWSAIHRGKFRSSTRSGYGLPPFLPQWLHDYAVGPWVLPVAEVQWPWWTAGDLSAEGLAPLDKIAAALVAAFSLPSTTLLHEN